MIRVPKYDFKYSFEGKLELLYGENSKIYPFKNLLNEEKGICYLWEVLENLNFILQERYYECVVQMNEGLINEISKLKINGFTSDLDEFLRIYFKEIYEYTKIDDSDKVLQFFWKIMNNFQDIVMNSEDVEKVSEALTYLGADKKY